MFLIYILMICIIFSTKSQSSPIQNSINENILFDLTTELIKINVEGVVHSIEAFKPIKNDQILTKKDETNYANLIWYSYGYPTILASDNQSPFYFNSKGFYIQVETLTKQHRSLIINELETKYSIELNDNQVKNLIPSKFECKLEIECDQFYYLDGQVANTLDFPLKVNFNVSKSSKEMKCLQDIVRESEDDFNFDCFLSTYSQNSNNVAQNNSSLVSLIGRSFTFNKSSIKSITTADKCLKQFDLLNERLIKLEEQVQKLLEDKLKKSDVETNFEPIPNPVDLETEVNQPYDGYH
jgi:hypothetical protein